MILFRRAISLVLSGGILVLLFTNFVLQGRSASPVQPAVDAPKSDPVSDRVWSIVFKNNPSLAAAEPLVKGIIVEMRRTTRIRDFPDEFQELVSGTKLSACFSLKLCDAGVIAHFRVEKPIGITDLIRYILDATCFGFLPDKNHRSEALATLDRIIRNAGYKNLPLTGVDKQYLHGTFRDVLTTNNHDRRHITPTLRNFSGGKSGSYRPLLESTRSAAELACQGL